MYVYICVGAKKKVPEKEDWDAEDTTPFPPIIKGNSALCEFLHLFFLLKSFQKNLQILIFKELN